MAVRKTKTTKAKPRTAGRTAGRTKTPKKRTAAKPGTAKAKSQKALTKKPNTKLKPNAQTLATLITNTTLLMYSFMDAAEIYQNLTPRERTRLISAGVRNYGFIEKTLDIARDNPRYLPPNFNVTEFADTLYEFDQIRQFYFIVEKLQSLASDSMLIKSNILYKEALRVYNSLKEQARAGVPGAQDLFNALEPFFKRRRVTEKPETQRQAIHEAISLIKGKSDGELIIKNLKPKKSGGVHEIVEEQLKNNIKFKDSAQGEI